MSLDDPLPTPPALSDMLTVIRSSHERFEAALEAWAQRHSISAEAKKDLADTMTATILETLERGGVIRPFTKA